MTIRSLIPPMTIGTVGADNHFGGLAYYALAGNDTVTGGGAQSLGSGNDFFSLGGTTATYGMAWGADGADTLVGADADSQYGGAIWVNILYGGSGADSLVGGTGGDRLFGDCMDMALAFCGMVDIPHAPGADTLSGGGGGDVLVGGEGADRLTGGADADLFVWEVAAELTTVDTITDFDAASDLLLFNHLIVPTGATPNLGAYLSLVPSGGNTLLQIDRDGSGGVYAKQTVATLTGSVTVLDASRVVGFTAEPIYLPQVGAVVASEWSDTVVRSFDLGSGGDASQYLPLYLLGGDDDVTVELGGSWYHLGDGNDTLTYRPGFLNGFPGDPAESFGMANLNVDGGRGDDTLNGGPGADRFSGGSGADVLIGNNGDDRLFGDCGDTDLAFCVMDASVEPASGADTISGGDGYDVIHGGGGADRLTGGAGSDLFIWEHVTDFGDTITDFETGADGDRLFFTELIIPQGANAIVSQYVKLQQSGGDTLVYLDRDGTGSAHADQLVVTLKGVAVASFSNGQLPGLLGSGLQPLEISSAVGANPEHVVGTYWADAIDLNGDAGYSTWNHHLLGGDDTVTSGLGGNYVLGDGNDRFTAKPATTDDLMVSGDAGNDTLVGGDGPDELTGGSGADSLLGGAGADYLFGDCNDQLLAFCFEGDAEMAGVEFVGGVDTIDGGTGADMIHGGEGADELTGGADSDLFVYESATEFGDTIRDFAPGAGGDKLLLNGLITSTAGANVSSYVFLQQSGTDTLVRFAANGSGASGGTVVATLKNVSASAIDLQNQILLGEELRVQSPPPENTAPVGANTTISAIEDQAKSGNLPAATDADGDPITYAKVGDPSHGTVTVAANGAYTYTPTGNYNGSDSFQYSISDGKATVNYTANVTVAAIDDAPTGALTIGGTPTQGQTLTLADTIADADGLGARTYAWLANGTPIAGATGTALVLDAAQVGKTISVRASYTDGGGKAETVTSLSTVAVASNGGGGGTLLSIAPADANQNEGNSGSTSYTFTVTRSGDISGASSANWAVSSATATGADFVGGTLPSGSVNFAAGATSKTITVQVSDDTVVEPDETFTVTLSTPSGATLAATTANGTIVNDDALPSLSIAPLLANKSEGNSGATNFTFTVTRGGDTSAVSSANWAVSSATATGADFAGGTLPSGAVSFAAGETSKTITVQVSGDTVVESDESFTVTLSGPSGATLAGTTANGTIANDDASAVPGVTRTGTAGIDTLTGSAGDDTINGLAGNDILTGLAGNDLIDGGTGLDTARYDAPRAQAVIHLDATTPPYAATVSVPGLGTDTLTDVERLRFSDVSVAFDITPTGNVDDPITKGTGGNAGKAYRLYQAALARTPDLAGLGYWISEIDNGAKLFDIATGFLESPEFKSKYGASPTNQEYTRALYLNVLGREPDADGYAYWNALLDGKPWNGVDYGSTTRQQMLVDFSEGNENKAHVIEIIGNGFDYLPWG